MDGTLSVVTVCGQHVWDPRSNLQQRKEKGGFGWIDEREEEKTEWGQRCKDGRKVRRERWKQSEPSNSLSSTQAVSQMNSLCPIQLAAGETEADAPRP